VEGTARGISNFIKLIRVTEVSKHVGNIRLQLLIAQSNILVEMLLNTFLKERAQWM
jgi:hypothetical protein